MSIKKLLAAIMLASVGVAANAASVSLVYTGGNDIDVDGLVLALAVVGDTLTFDLVMDFSDQPTLGGGFDINWNPAIFALDSYFSAGQGDPGFGRDPQAEDGRLYNGAVGNFNGLTDGTIGHLSFTLIGFGSPADGLITPSGTAGDSGPWIDGTDFVSVINPDYVASGVFFMPVPAAVWLMFSGMGTLFCLARRKTALFE